MNELEVAKPDETVSEQELRTLSSFLFNLIEAQITRADTKAGLVIAADAVLITVSLLITRRGAFLILFDNAAAPLERIMSVLTLLMFGALFVSMLNGLLAARPALQVKGGGETLLFFGRIAQFKHRDFLEAFSKQTPAQHHESLLTEVYNTSLIATQKFARVRYSIDYLIMALLIWGVIVLVNALTFTEIIN